MKQRNPLAVFFLPLITFGIYNLVWFVKTKNEMNKKGANTPTAWLLVIPFVSYYWFWKYSEGVELVTGGKQSPTLTFVLVIILGAVGCAIIQNDFNKIGTDAAQSPAVFGANPYVATQPAVATTVDTQEPAQFQQSPNPEQTQNNWSQPTISSQPAAPTEPQPPVTPPQA